MSQDLILHDTGIVVYKHLLHCHGRHISYQYPSERVRKGSIYPDHIELNLALGARHDFQREIVLELGKIPGVIVAGVSAGVASILSVSHSMEVKVNLVSYFVDVRHSEVVDG